MAFNSEEGVRIRELSGDDNYRLSSVPKSAYDEEVLLLPIDHRRHNVNSQQMDMADDQAISILKKNYK